LVSIHPVAALSYGIQIIGNLEVCRTRFYVVHEILTFDRRDFTNISKS